MRKCGAGKITVRHLNHGGFLSVTPRFGYSDMLQENKYLDVVQI